MRCCLWLQFVALLVAGLSAEEGEQCPAPCSCSEEGIGPYIARCSTLNAGQRFTLNIARLIIKDVPQTEGLVLQDDTFGTVGLKSVSTIYFTNSTIKTIEPRAFHNMKELRILKVENSRMQMQSDMFNTTELQQLILVQSQIAFKSPRYLFQIPTLTELTISECQLKSLPPLPFSQTPLLEVVNLASNNIKLLDNNTFASLRDLREVDLSDNLIGELGPGTFVTNEHLEFIDLHKNPLFSLKHVSIPSLNDLDLSLCKFSEINKETFSGFPNLNRLNMSGNAIRIMAEDTFSTLHTLLDLDLSNNALKGPLHRGIFLQNRALQTLKLAHNPLVSVKKETFNELDDLYMLDLSHCGLQSLEREQFKGLGRLATLNLAGNNLMELQPSALNKFIVNLDLSFNKFEVMEFITFPVDSKLKTVSLAGNPLKTVRADRMVDLSHLQVLDLSSCGLSSLWLLQRQKPCRSEPCPTTTLDQLTKLLISKNNIHSILTSQLDVTPALTHLDISDNPIVCNAAFNSSLQWLDDHEVDPVTSSDKIYIPANPVRNPDAERIPMPRWNAVKEHICGRRDREEVETFVTDTNMVGTDYSSKEDISEKDNMVSNDCFDMSEADCGVQQEAISNKSQNYLWPILVVSFSALAILLSLSILGAFVLRWSRQKNSYGAAVIRNHLNTPRLKRERSSIYQQLYEDLNSPTTPVMIVKNTNQTQYNFPEPVKDENPKGYISYLSKEFKDSKPNPEAV